MIIYKSLFEYCTKFSITENLEGPEIKQETRSSCNFHAVVPDIITNWSHYICQTYMWPIITSRQQ